MPSDLKGIVVELWAKVKRSSKYYNQNFFDAEGKPLKQPITHLREGQGEYIYEMRTGVYRREDIDLFIKREDGSFQRI